MSTVLTPFSNQEHSKTSTTPTHTALLPFVVIEKRKVAEGNRTMVEQSNKVVKATQNAASETLANKVSVEIIARYPLEGDSADLTAVLTLVKEIVNSDNFANSISTQEWLQ